MEGKRGGRTAVLVGTGLGSRWHPAGGGRGAAHGPPLGVARPAPDGGGAGAGGSALVKHGTTAAVLSCWAVTFRKLSFVCIFTYVLVDNM